MKKNTRIRKKKEQSEREHLKELRDAISFAMSMKNTQLAESRKKELEEVEHKMKMINYTIENIEEKENFVRDFLQNEGENFIAILLLLKIWRKKLLTTM